MDRVKLRIGAVVTLGRAAALLALAAAVSATAQVSPELAAGDELATPTDLVAVPTGPNNLHLSWKDNATAEDFYLIAFKYGNVDYDILGMPFGSDVEERDCYGIAVGVPYTFKVACAADGESSDYSNEFTVTIPGKPIGGPTQLTAKGARKKIKLTWKDNAIDEDGYQIDVFRNDFGGFGWSTITKVGANVTSYTATGLKRNATYKYRIKATRGEALSVPSSSAEGKTKKK